MEEKQEHKPIVSEERIIEERKKKFLNFIKTNPFWIFFVVLIILIGIGVNIRMQPLIDHGGTPGLWDATTNDYTLGPDLDPFLFLRYAKDIIESGSIPQVDMMRNVPLGFSTVGELPMVSYMIVLTYKAVNLFGTYSINFAGAFMPVWVFALTIIAFFFFVREIFLRKEDDEHKNKANYIKASLISLISTLFMIIIPGFLSRTVAGIPEKESVGFLFMFLAFFLFLKAWKSEKIIFSSIFAILAGIITAFMGLTWGGVVYIYVAVALATFAAFLLNKVGTKETVAYLLWLTVAIIITFMFTTHYSLQSFITSLDSGLASFVFAILLTNIVLVKTNLRAKISEKTKLPESFVSIIITILLAIMGILILFGSSFFIDKFQDINRIFFNPVTGRWSTTVAENKQPYFGEWAGSFGSIVFWLSLAGAIFLFYKMFNKIKKKDAAIITLCYVLFLLGLVFSRYSSSSIFNGENFISKLIYYSSVLILLGAIIFYYIRYSKEKDESFEKIEFEYIFLFALFTLTLLTARGAVRLIMVLLPIAPIFLSYLIVELGVMAKNSEKDKKLFLAILFFVVLILAAYASSQYYQGIKSQSYNSVPYYYTVQWQNAMSWIRDNTPANAVFAHWWDYGYWVQSIGNRATVTDGGNMIVWWNYLTGRLVLTGDNQKDSLEFLYAHNATYLLIDSSDIGKYGAFSQIGSNETYDRLSQGPVTFFSDSSQVQEKKNETVRTYNIPAGSGQVSLVSIEEDISYEENSSKTTLFKENSAVMGFMLTYSQDGLSLAFKQPQAVFYSGGKQILIPIRYLYYNNQLMDYKTGLDAAIRIIPRVSSTSIDSMGSLIYVSPRVMRGYLGQVYVLNNALGNFNNFQLVHSEIDIVSKSLINQGYDLDEFVYFDSIGLVGPIKIWQIKYTGTEKINEDHLLKLPPSYITWKF